MSSRKCKNCKKEFKLRRKNAKHIYCSVVCAGLGARTGETIVCRTCGKKTYKRRADLKKSKSGFNFCCHSCSAKWSNQNRDMSHVPNYGTGKSTYNKRAKDAYGEKCNNGNRCPLNGMKLPSYMYEVDHIDGNRVNNGIDNLQVLCVWCHRRKHFG